MKNDEVITILLVDDHPFVLEGLRVFLDEQSELVVLGEAVDGEEAIHKAQALSPNVVVMDIALPVLNGLDATRQLRKIAPDIKVIVLSTPTKPESFSQAIAAGAQGYVTKSSATTELLQAIRAVHSGNTYFPDGIAALSGGGQKVFDRLTAREREILKLIAEGLSNQVIASGLGISVRTVQKHREGIMNKLNLHNVVELTRYAVANGIVEIMESEFPFQDSNSQRKTGNEQE